MLPHSPAHIRGGGITQYLPELSVAVGPAVLVSAASPVRMTKYPCPSVVQSNITGAVPVHETAS
jgi:hypothetical protein